MMKATCDDYVENEFDNFMIKQGFSRVSNDVGESPTFKNADYVNKSENIVVELKILQKEFFEKGGVLDSLNSIVINPVNIDENGIGQYEFTLPVINREGKFDNFEEPLRRVIKKANTQLKETRQFYFTEEKSIGFLILAQVGFNKLGADITALLVQKILNQEFKSIDGVIICVPYEFSKNPTTLEVNPQCVSVTKEIDLEKKKKCMELADRWIDFLESGGHIVV